MHQTTHQTDQQFYMHMILLGSLSPPEITLHTEQHRFFCLLCPLLFLECVHVHMHVHVHVHVHMLGWWVGGRACVHASQSEMLIVWVLLFLQQPSIPHCSCSPAVTAWPEDCAFAEQILSSNILSSGLKAKEL